MTSLIYTYKLRVKFDYAEKSQALYSVSLHVFIFLRVYFRILLPKNPPQDVRKRRWIDRIITKLPRGSSIGIICLCCCFVSRWSYLLPFVLDCLKSGSFFKFSIMFLILILMLSRDFSNFLLI